MKKNDLLAIMEQLAPKDLAMAFDNVGLLVDNGKDDIKKVMLALDCTVTTASEAAEWGADMLITHHPQMLDGIKHISPFDPDTAGIYVLIRNGIAHFTAHTNLDAAIGGVNDCLADIFELCNVSKMQYDLLGRIGYLDREMSLYELAKLVEKRLKTSARICGAPDKIVKCVGVLGGAGGGEVENAYRSGAEVLLTGEIKHHQALRAQQLGMCVIQAGHYETEHIVLEPLRKRLQERTLDVQYKVASFESSCLTGI